MPDNGVRFCTFLFEATWAVCDFRFTNFQVKIELEHERRLRTQQALDEAERRQYVLQRDCDNKTRECQEYSAKIKDLKVKHEARLRQVTEENRRLEKLLQMKETEIMSSEARAKELVMRAEEFEDMFNGQLEVSLETFCMACHSKNGKANFKVLS